MSTKQRLHAACEAVRERRPGWHQYVTEDAHFQSRWGLIRSYDMVGANLGPMIELFEQSGFMDVLERGEIQSVCDVGCGNGDLSFGYSMAGFRTTALDLSWNRSQAPTAVSKISSLEAIPLAVVDLSIDTHFTMEELRAAVIYDPRSCFPEAARFDLTICFGLLDHLRNPYAFLESLRGVSTYVALGASLLTHLPNLEYRVDHQPLAYMLGDGAPDAEETLYWRLSEPALHAMVRRCGFEILGTHTASNNPLCLSAPDRTDLDLRGFVMLKAQ